MVELFSNLKKAFKAAISLLTTISVQSDESDLQKLSERMYLFPVVGAVIGLLVGVISLVILKILPFGMEFLGSVIVIAILYSITGIQHFDGVVDVGDALFTSGDREDKIRAMKDTTVGAGGILFGVLTSLALFSVLFPMAVMAKSPYPECLLLISILMFAEICAKQGMVTLAVFGGRLHEGMGSLFVDRAEPREFWIGVVIMLLLNGFILYLVGGFILGLVGVAASILFLIFSRLLLRSINRSLGGVNGDVLGFANEACRILSILLVALILWTL